MSSTLTIVIMRYIFEQTWSNFLENVKNEKVIIYGAGKNLIDNIDLFKRMFEIKYIVDQDEKKIGKYISDVQIKSILCLQYEMNPVVLVTPSNTNGIIEYLKVVGIGRVWSLFWMNHIEVQTSILTQNIFSSKINVVENYLDDEKSRDILKAIIKKRKESEFDYSDLYDENEYFREDFFTKKKDEVYIDVGAFNGDSIERYVHYNTNYSKIYAFEADRYNFMRLNQNMIVCSDKMNVTVRNIGIYDHHCYMNFSVGDGVSSRMSIEEGIEGNERVECYALDELDFDRVDFIKMDIEGGEKAALIGAKNILRKHTPNLAICLYHHPDDLWGIPMLIKEINDQYKFAIRHHSVGWWDTVLYAWVDK